MCRTRASTVKGNLKTEKREREDIEEASGAEARSFLRAQVGRRRREASKTQRLNQFSSGRDYPFSVITANGSAANAYI